jgi:hypothetical protein
MSAPKRCSGGSIRGRRVRACSPDERSEIRDRPVRLATPPPGFASLTRATGRLYLFARTDAVPLLEAA